MTRPHPLTAMTERVWSQAWRAEQRVVDRMNDRGTWLPNVIERRGWGVVRWTSGRPAHAASSGQAVPETFVVLRPDVSDPARTADIAEALRDEPPAFQAAGIGLARQQLSAAAIGAGAVGLLALVVSLIASLPFVVLLLAVLFGAVLGGVGGGALAKYRADRTRAEALGDTRKLRVVTGRYAPESWLRLVEAATVLESSLPKRGDDIGEADRQAADAVRAALWEASGLLLGSSDHTGVEVLADGVMRLARAHRS